MVAALEPFLPVGEHREGGIGLGKVDQVWGGGPGVISLSTFPSRNSRYNFLEEGRFFGGDSTGSRAGMLVHAHGSTWHTIRSGGVGQV